jgi:tRNA threonylcarbamoyladenosine biosynthesis protein TsaB
MIVLGFDTSTPATVVGLRLADGTTLQARDDPEGEERPGHATRLLPLASGLLRDAGLVWDAITRIAVGIGPGTFTGLRIGVSTARGIAQSLGVELVGVSSPRALSYTACMDLPRESTGVMAVIDARRGEVFVAAYDGEVELIAPGALSPTETGELFVRAQDSTGLERWIVVGDGAMRYREQLERPGVFIPDARSSLHQIQASAICLLGERAALDGARVVPDYRRRPDAELALQGTP